MPSEGPSATCVVGMTRLMTCQLHLRTLTQSQKTCHEFDSEQLSLFQRNKLGYFLLSSCESNHRRVFAKNQTQTEVNDDVEAL